MPANRGKRPIASGSRICAKSEWVLALLAVMILGGCVMGGGPAVVATAAPDISQGLALSDQGRYLEAYNFYREIAKVYPNYGVYAATARQKAFEQMADQAADCLDRGDLNGFLVEMRNAGQLKPNPKTRLIVNMVDSCRRNGISDPAIIAQLREPEPAAPSADRPYIVVYELAAQSGLPQELMGPLTDTVRSALLNSRKYRVVDREHMAQVMKELEHASESMVESTDAAVEFGQAMNAQKIMVGSVAWIGGKYQLVLKVVDVATSVTDASVDVRQEGNPDVLFDMARRAVAELGKR